jgi:hypothetical protein
VISEFVRCQNHSDVPQYTMESLIACAIRCESEAWSLYSLFADWFSAVGDVADFWQKFAEDELRNIDQLENVRESISPDVLLSPMDPKITRAVLAVEEIFKRNLTENLVDLNDAYVLAHEIESSELNAIFRLITQKCIPEQWRKDFIFAQVENHVEKLNQFGNRIDPILRSLIRISRDPESEV